MTKPIVTRTRWVRVFVAALTALLFAALLAGCSPQVTGQLGQLQQLAEKCPDGPVDVTVDIDGSGSQEGSRIGEQAVEVVADQAAWVATCGGRLRVMLFATNASETAVLLDESLEMAGATQIARLRRVPDRVAEVTAQVEEAYTTALATLPRDGSDVMSQLGLAKEHAASVSDDTTVAVIVVTDALDTTVPGLADSGLTVERAGELAASVPALDLSGIEVSVVGVGRTSGGRLPTSAIDGLKRFYTDVLTASGAASVSVVTDYAPMVGRS